MKPVLTILVCLGLVGCTDLPDLDNRIDPAALDAPFPGLVPLDGIVARTEARTAGAAEAGPPQGRVDALRARAARLRGPIIDAATRARMARGIDRSRF